MPTNSKLPAEEALPCYRSKRTSVGLLAGIRTLIPSWPTLNVDLRFKSSGIE
jgi:hypothetical protein